MSRSGDVENRENVPGVSAVMVQFRSGVDIGIAGVVFLKSSRTWKSRCPEMVCWQVSYGQPKNRSTRRRAGSSVLQPADFEARAAGPQKYCKQRRYGGAAAGFRAAGGGYSRGRRLQGNRGA